MDFKTTSINYLPQFLQIKRQRTTSPERPIKPIETTPEHKLVLPVVSSPKIDYSTLTNNRSSAVKYQNQTVMSSPAVQVTPALKSFRVSRDAAFDGNYSGRVFFSTLLLSSYLSRFLSEINFATKSIDISVIA